MARTVFLLVAAMAVPAAISHSAHAAGALVLYDYRPADPFGKLGKAYAIMLRNLLGHFDIPVDLVPVNSYTTGSIETHDATFYLGAFYDNQVPSTFLTDVAATQKPVVWFKHNIWQLAWNPAYNFTTRYGITFNSLRGMNAAPSAADPAPGFFDTISYGGKQMVKYYSYDTATSTVFADPEMGHATVADPALAQVIAPVRNSRTGEEIPYVIRAGNFWYVADVPFSYIGPRDRYLALCDLLHDMLGVQHAVERRAMVRLEDVGAKVSQTAMQQLTDDLRARNAPNGIPFSIAVIPFYRDPLGAYTGGTPEQIRANTAGAVTLRNSLNYARTRGGSFVMHGYTHQYEAQRNPWSGVSADDFEMWNIVTNRPTYSATQALARLRAGRTDLASINITAYAWETPHYHASPVVSRAVPQVFPTAYQRAVYYTDDNGSLTNGEYAVGQFFPYIIQSDYYGQYTLPENLGNIEYDISSIDPSSNVVYTAQDILTNADYAQVIRDGFASFFFHPFWLEPGLPVTTGRADFQRVLDGITAMGYTWVGGASLVRR
jgi:uncharacterized protein YdaL